MSLPRRTRTPARAAGLAGAVALATALTLAPSAAEAAAWPGHPDRTLVRHKVLPGETATGLAVRFHAWTAELLRLNGLGSHGVLYQGQVIRIPVVVSAVRKAHGQVPRPAHHKPKHHKPRHHKPRHHKPPHRKPLPLLMHATTPPGRGWLHTDLTRDQGPAAWSPGWPTTTASPRAWPWPSPGRSRAGSSAASPAQARSA